MCALPMRNICIGGAAGKPPEVISEYPSINKTKKINKKKEKKKKEK